MKLSPIYTLLALSPLMVAPLFLTPAAPPADHEDEDELELGISRIYWEYNASDEDLGVHVLIDGEDWHTLKIRKPNGNVLFDVRGRGPYRQLGLTELFFEGAEPALADVPLEDLLALFPEGEYDFEGLTVDGHEIEGEALFSHAIPDGPEVFASVGTNNFLQISWNPVTAPPPGFPSRPIVITGYQVVMGSFQLTLPPTATSVTVPPEFVATLPAGTNEFEVLAIDRSRNQTLRSGTFVK